MEIIKYIIRVPFLNIFAFVFTPYKAYRQYFLDTLEEKGLTLEQVWEGCDAKERLTLLRYDLMPKNARVFSDNISTYCKREDAPEERAADSPK